MPVYQWLAHTPHQHCGEAIVIPRWQIVPDVPENYSQLYFWLEANREQNGHSFWQIKRGDKRDFYEFIPYTDDLLLRTRLEINEFGDFPMGYVNAGWAEMSHSASRFTGRVEPRRLGDMPLTHWQFVGMSRTYEFIVMLTEQFKKEREAYERNES